jgi:hypothetical protein
MLPSMRSLREFRFRDPKGIYFPAILATFVLVTRIPCRAPLYFADDGAHIHSILLKTYVIQPPGYWLFNYFAGLFSDPVLAITVMNILFSVAGVVIFYYTACFFTGRVNAFLAALAYSTIYYVWFSGEIHCTYASQILFPVAIYYVLLCYERDQAKWMLWLAALLFAMGAGLRPSDGAFLIPMVLYFSVFRMPRKEAFWFLPLIALLCLGWLVPTRLAYEHYTDGVRSLVGYVAAIAKERSILSGVRKETVANFARYAIVIFAGFWPVLGLALRSAIHNRNDWRIRALVIWIVPGSLFFLFCTLSLAPYLNLLTAAILLLVVSAPGAWTGRLLIVTALWNAFVFLALSPIPALNLRLNIVNSFVLEYTRGGIEQRYNGFPRQMQSDGNVELR